MYRGFSLNIENESLFDNDIKYKSLIESYRLDNNCLKLYDDINPDTKSIINKKINSFVYDNKKINLTDIGENWFPKIEAGIYIAFS